MPSQISACGPPVSLAVLLRTDFLQTTPYSVHRRSNRVERPKRARGSKKAWTREGQRRTHPSSWAWSSYDVSGVSHAETSPSPACDGMHTIRRANGLNGHGAHQVASILASSSQPLLRTERISQQKGTEKSILPKHSPLYKASTPFIFFSLCSPSQNPVVSGTPRSSAV
jgi:hypothetical protein